jgi:hypothetical protein
VSRQVIWEAQSIDQAAGFLRDDPDGVREMLDAVARLAEEPRPDGWRADLDAGGAGRSWRRPRRPGAANIASALSRPVKPTTGPGSLPSRPGGQGGVLVPVAAQRDGDDASHDSAVAAGSVCGRRLAAADHTEISRIAAYRKPLPVRCRE